jgi:hypothetical protein
VLPLANAVALRREVPSIRLDPATRRVVELQALPSGALIEDAERILDRAAVEESSTVMVRVLHQDGVVGLSEVSVPALRHALEEGA